jgi:hypothetical protein
MATTSNYIQWPTHRRKAAERRRSRKAITKGVINGKASRKETTNTARVEMATNQEPMVVVHQAGDQETA